MKIIGLEEHFAIPEVVQAWQSLDGRSQDMAIKASTEGEGGRRLLDIGHERLSAMDDMGIDVQVLSLTTPGVQNLPADAAIHLASTSNDRIAAATQKHPDRFQGFATLPTPTPYDAARELERAVRISASREPWSSDAPEIATLIIRTTGRSSRWLRRAGIQR